MGAAIRGACWESTPLGAPEGWPAALKIAVSMLLNSAFPKCLCWGPELICIYNDGFVPILGSKHPALGRSFREVWSEVWDDIGPIVDRAMAGEATFVEDFELEVLRSDHPDHAFFTFCYSPVRDENGVVRGMLDTVIETTGKVRAQRAATLLNSELQHRSRNTFALVAALVRQCHRNAGSLQEASDMIGERLHALAEAQEVLSGLSGDVGDLRVVAEHAVAPFRTGGREVEIDGPPVEITHEQAFALSLALHELGTNATKYGALSDRGGAVRLNWSQTGSSILLDWVERAARPITAPERRGFGSFLIEQALPAAFDGTVRADFPPEGARYHLTGRLAARRPVPVPAVPT